MSLFEIEINPEFKISNSIVFLTKEKFYEYCKFNNLCNSCNNDIQEYLLNDYLLNIRSDEFVLKRGNVGEDKSDIQVITNYFKNRLNTTKHHREGLIVLYPEWLLFFIAVKKIKDLNYFRNEIENYIEHFQYISEIRHKKYVLRNLNHFVNCQEYNIDKTFDNTLRSHFNSFIQETSLDIDKHYRFLNFLYQFHSQLKDNERYKLMWNLETYVIETINLLLGYGIELNEVYLKVSEGNRGTFSTLHEVHVNKPLYVLESKFFFKSYLKKINDLFNVTISIDDFMSILTRNDKFEDLLFSYIELIKRFNANKKNDIVMSALIKGIVLGIEEFMREGLDCNKPNDSQKCIKKIKPGSHLFSKYFNLIPNNSTNDVFFNGMEDLCNENDSLEKYLVIYYHARNYLAHNNIDMEKFFSGKVRQKTFISSVMDSIIVTIYQLRELENSKLSQSQ